MKLFCIHCGQDFAITAEQLGTRGKCPHCRATIRLPRADLPADQHEDLQSPRHWMESSLSGIGTFIIHLLVLILLALVPWGDLADGMQGEGEQVVIGNWTRQSLTEQPAQQLEAEKVNDQNNDSSMTLSEEVLPPTATDPLSDKELDVNLFSPTGSADSSMDINAIQQMTLDASGSEDFGQLVAKLKRDGLDIVITFDSTGSMDGEIQEVKDKIQRMGTALMKLIPKTRIGVCTYRDKDDQYVVQGLPLTRNLDEVIHYLDTIRAAGGGDEPEAVKAGLDWAINQNTFRRRARKVVLLFGDAPPHRDERARCLKLSADFRRQAGGIVSTVTCHSDQRIEDFVEIAQMGGGEAFLTRDEREIMTQLIVLVFGSQHRAKVLEAFDLMNQ